MSKSILKLIVAGDVGSGKTSFVKAISEIEPITTDEYITETNYLGLKEKTTVAMDFGLLNIDEDVILHIYGTPGQKRFNFMWEVLSENAFGVIFLADASRLASINNTNEIIDYFQEKLPHLPYIVCITKLDLPESLPFSSVVELIRREAPFLPINATKADQVRDALMSMIAFCLD